MPRNCLDKPSDWRLRRAKVASLAAKRARRMRATRDLSGLTKAQVWRRAYATGYSCAMRWWKHQMATALKKRAA